MKPQGEELVLLAGLKGLSSLASRENKKNPLDWTLFYHEWPFSKLRNYMYYLPVYTFTDKDILSYFDVYK